MDPGFSQLAVLWEREKTQFIAFGSSVVALKRCTGHHLELLAIKPDAAPNVPLASPDPEKKMAKLQMFNTYTIAREHYRRVKRPRYVIFNITHVQRLVENIDNN
jgi:hypothetical protein